MARRNPSDAAALDPALTQKKRARRRLVGAIVLGIAAAITLPLVLDSEPRQTITDVEIEIPSREAALPSFDAPEAAVAPRDADSAGEPVVPPVPSEPVDAIAGADTVVDAKTDASAAARPAPAEDAKSANGVAANAPAGSEAKPDAPAGMRSASKTPSKAASAQRSASAAPSGSSDASAAKATSASPAAAPAPTAAAPSAAKSASAAPSSPKSASAAPASGTRFALQVGAYANAGSARAQLDKARRTGLRAYTETVATAQGERTRVRVGPFPTREEAEKARATLKLAGMESAVVDAR